ncbi:nucleoside triphosphate pyrophosphohydrolase [Henriciella aquimarina]|uniref:nucleoside triphosphate pyrophosphohydrolase n=1 Tax=Henriciella aquimarina TaxID=545261 RepID=UPI0009FE1948|nr:nucleoside triphosphate pyrophosphohydrolase [Henriciella aquimarina]
MAPSSPSEFERLKEIMAKLRDPDGGCPWDLEQDFASIAPYTIEEAYEVADAIERQDFGELRDELGDLLLQVVFHSQMASEAGHFSVEDVAHAINDKMVRRHPHVFGTPDGRSASGQTDAWEAIKAQERANKTGNGESVSALDGVARALPALMRAEKLQKRAARTGFDWTNPADILEKLDEETGEVREAIDEGDIDAIEDEIGDLLFVVANLARRFKLDPEIALRKANAKFERRFRAMELLAASTGRVFSDLSLEDQNTLWGDVKRDEPGRRSASDT